MRETMTSLVLVELKKDVLASKDGAVKLFRWKTEKKKFLIFKVKFASLQSAYNAIVKKLREDPEGKKTGLILTELMWVKLAPKARKASG